MIMDMQSTQYHFIPNQKYTYSVEAKLLLHIECITCCVSKLYFTNELNELINIPKNIDLYLHNIPEDIEGLLGGKSVDVNKNMYIVPKQVDQKCYLLDICSGDINIEYNKELVLKIDLNYDNTWIITPWCRTLWKQALGLTNV